MAVIIQIYFRWMDPATYSGASAIAANGMLSGTIFTAVVLNLMPAAGAKLSRSRISN